MNNDWDNPGNWDTGFVPGMSHNAIIPSGTPSCNLPNGSVLVGSVENYGVLNAGAPEYTWLSMGQSFQNFGELNVSTNLSFSGPWMQDFQFFNGGNIQGDGSFEVEHAYGSFLTPAI